MQTHRLHFPTALLHRAVSGTYVCWDSHLIAQPALQQAYTDAGALMGVLWDNKGSCVNQSLKPLMPYYKVQDRNVKAQLQLPLSVFQGMDQSSARTETHSPAFAGPKQSATDLIACLPLSVLQVGLVFYTIALHYLETVVREFFPSAEGHGILTDLSRQSVYRIWWYGSKALNRPAVEVELQKGETRGKTADRPGDDLLCRAHHDPGLCTVMPLGSLPGLEIAVPKDPTLEADPRFQGQQGQREPRGPQLVTSSKQSIEWGVPVPDRNLSDGADHDSSAGEPGVPLLLMNNTSLQGLSGGAIRHCYHRVAMVQQEDAALFQVPPRINLVLELRPSRNDWYTFKPSTAEVEKLQAFQSGR
jgi:hypothetical protein